MTRSEYLSSSPELKALYRRLQNRIRWIQKLSATIRGFKTGENPIPQRPAPAARRTPDTMVINAATESTEREPLDWRPFFKIPNVRKFKITVGEVDKLFLHYGINRRTAPNLEFEPYRNRRFLRYAEHNIMRLRTATNHHVYWRMACVLMERSVVFNLMAVAKSFDRYHRELPLQTIMSWVFGAMSIARDQGATLELMKVWIPKPNGKRRPLGVPTPVWRVRMTVLAWMLMTRYDSLIPDWQHGFRPKRGTLTAWTSVLTNVITSRYVYEFDLKAFFDQVDVVKVLEWLYREHGLSDKVNLQIRQMALYPRLNFKSNEAKDQPQASDTNLNRWGPAPTEFTFGPDQHLADTPGFKERYPPPPPPPGGFPAPHAVITFNLQAGAAVDPTRPGYPLPKTRRGSTPAVAWHPPEDVDATGYSAIPWAFDPERVKGENTGDRYYLPTGFPQGANISPFLSILQLSMGQEPKFAKMLMYADDGLFYSDSPFTEEDVVRHFQSLGIEINLEKSGWVREIGWHKPLKFLGLTYDGTKDMGTLKPLSFNPDMPGTLTSSTREGAALEFDKSDLVRAVSSMPLTPPKDFMAGSASDYEVYMVYTLSGLKEMYKTLKEARARKAVIEVLAPGSYPRIARLGPDALMLTDDVDSHTTWASIAKSSIWGLIQARMYNGDWNTAVEQNFNLNYVGQSWMAKRGWRGEVHENELLTFANSTSFAFYDIADLIKKARTKATWMRNFKAGLISLDQLNQYRLRLGYGPLKGAYTKVINLLPRTYATNQKAAANLDSQGPERRVRQPPQVLRDQFAAHPKDDRGYFHVMDFSRKHLYIMPEIERRGYQAAMPVYNEGVYLIWEIYEVLMARRRRLAGVKDPVRKEA